MNVNYELHVKLVAPDIEQAMDAAHRIVDTLVNAIHVTVHEEITMPILKQVGSVGTSRGEKD